MVVLINPNVELGSSRLGVDTLESIEEGKREEFVEFVEFVELTIDKVMVSFSLADPATGEKWGPNEVSINNIDSDMKQIMQYFTPVEIDKKCIKKIHSL